MFVTWSNSEEVFGHQMKSLRRLSLAEQTADYLRERLLSGHWGGKLPGVNPLCAELQVSQATVRAAFRQMEAEGLIAAGGVGRSRTVAAPGTSAVRRGLRVGILLHEACDRHPVEIRHGLEGAGHSVFLARKSQVELGYDLRRIVRHVGESPADAWVVVAGTREVLAWFATQPVSVFALFGRRGGFAIAGAGPDKLPAYLSATRELMRLGHRRIALICLKPRRLPEPGTLERAFLAELAAHGIRTGDFNLPDWEETPAGFHRMLASLFHHTPPTALLLDDVALIVATQQFLAGRDLHVPEQVSLVCTDHDDSFDWCQPAIAHMRWNSQSLVRRVVQWANAVSRRRVDLRQTLFPAEFVRGGTIGPVWKEG